MSCIVEYHNYVPRRLSNTVALFGLIAAFSLTAYAQVNGVPASVTSPGFGGRAINGTPASVTSLGPRGFTPNSNPGGGVRFFTNVPPRNGNSDGHHHHRRDSNFFPVLGVYPVPVAVPYAADPEANVDEYDSEEQGGPTIFDRRGHGAETYVPPVNNVRRAPRATEEVASAEPAPDLPEPTPPEPTVLVFKDGHELEIGNYAIVGQTLFDLSVGHSRRIALADLDLENTLKKNEDHGISFQLPPGTQVN